MDKEAAKRKFPESNATRNVKPKHANSPTPAPAAKEGRTYAAAPTNPPSPEPTHPAKARKKNGKFVSPKTEKNANVRPRSAKR